jgi:hypothetical protein
MGTEIARREELAARVEAYHGVTLEQVLADVEYLRDAGDSVIAGGSLAYGLGNHLSDLDLLVAGSTTVESSRVPIEHFVGSLRVDVWKLAQDLIEETFDRAEEALESPAALHGSFGDVDHETDLKLLHRIAFGVVVDGAGIEPPPGRDYHGVAAGLVVREYAERMRSSALLAQLALPAGRPLLAVVNARQVVEEALNATIASRGVPFSGDKWLRERLAGEAADLAGLYEPFGRLPEDPGRDAARFVEDALAVCRRLWGLDLATATLATAARWGNTDLRAAKVGEDRLLLSARFGALWSLDEGEAEAWDRLAATVDADEPEASWPLAECDAATLALCLRLHEHGLLELRWSDGVSIRELDAAGEVPA